MSLLLVSIAHHAIAHADNYWPLYEMLPVRLPYTLFVADLLACGRFQLRHSGVFFVQIIFIELD